MSSSHTPLASSLHADLVRLVGAAAVITDPDRLLVYETDGLARYRSPPAAVILPEDTEACARAVGFLHAEGVSTVPRGAGTGLSGGAVASSTAVVIGTARMGRILEIDAGARRARVQAGVVNSDLSAAAEPHGLTYAPDPSSQTACTLGGNVGENAGGPHCLKYGVTSRYVTGLTVVADGGEVLELGGAGGTDLDLVGLFVGSEGCFGLATEIELALVGIPEGTRTLLATFGRPDEAGAAVSAIIAAGLLPAALEIVDGSTIRAVEASIFAAGYPVEAGAALIVEFDGAEAGLDQDEARAEALCRDHGAVEIRRARSAAERTALWKGRKKAFGAMGRLAPDLLVQDATVPRSTLPDVLRTIAEIGSRHGLDVANVFHAGDGNLHPNLLFDRRDADLVERVERASREIMEACVAVGGTITGEHGVGLDKRDYMPLVFGPDELSAMAGVWRALDPEGRWNPGKVLPAGTEPPPLSKRVVRGPSDGHTTAAVLSAVEALGVAASTSPEGIPVALPTSTDEVAALLSRASESGWKVRPRALGQSLAGPRGPQLLIGTEGLVGDGTYEPADLTMSAPAGTPVTSLRSRAEAAGQWLPVDGLGSAPRLFGEWVASGGGGALAGAFGALRDLVLGLTLVTGDGRILRLGGAVVKNVAGFDLVRLAVGSRGTLGVITSATLRLFPAPAEDRTVVFEGASMGALEREVERALAAEVAPTSVEVFEGAGAARLLIRVTGSSATVGQVIASLSAQLGRAGRVLDASEAGAERSALREPFESGARVLRLRGVPSASAMARMAEEARSLGGALRALPERGWLDVTAGGEGESDTSFLDAVRSAAGVRATRGGRLAVLRGGPGLRGAAGSAAVVPARRAATLRVARLEGLFDPAGVLTPEEA